jgi:putative membrane protein
MFRNIGILIFALLGSLPLAMTAQAADEISAQEFVTKAAASGMAEVKAGELALQKGTSLKVKEFAQMMVTEHAAANRQLSTLALKRKIRLPESPALMAQAKQKILEWRGERSFDRAYANNQVVVHKASVALFHKAANSEDEDIRAFAIQTLPQLEQHLRLAEDLAVDVGASR